MAQFRNLVFEGGGVKGIAYAGALEVLEQEDILRHITRVAGTSAGAITATLLALGATAGRVAEIVGGTNFNDFMDDDAGVLRDLHRLRDHYGWCRGEAFTDWIRHHIQAQSAGEEFPDGNPDLTFADLRTLAQQHRWYKDLFVVGSNLTQQRVEVYSADHTPEMPIWLAVRISMSIPVFFTRVDKDGDVLVDGGVTWNYPLDLFDDRRYLPGGGSGRIYNKETLGFRVDTPAEIAAATRDAWNLPSREIDNIFAYLGALVGYMTEMANKSHLEPQDWDRTVFINAGGIKATDFDLSDAQIQELVANGRQGARDYFRWFNDPQTTPAPQNRV